MEEEILNAGYACNTEMPMTPKKSIDSEHIRVRTRDKLLQIAAQLFSEKGFDGTSIRMICSKANVNVSSINYYFTNKEQLYFEVHRYINNLTSRNMAWIHDEPRIITDFDEWQCELKRIVLEILQVEMANDKMSLCRRRILALEMARPSSCLPMLLETFYQPVKTYMYQFFKMIAPDVQELQLEIWVSFVLNQIMGFLRMVPPWDKLSCPEGITIDEWMKMAVDSLVDIIRKCVEQGQANKRRP